MNSRRALLVPLAFVIAIAGASGYLLLHHGPTSAKIAPPTQVRTTPSPDPITIAAIRNHPTPGGVITITSQLAARDSCPTYVVSYPSDGLKINALMTLPPTAKPAAGYPVLILAHGYIVPSQYQTAGLDYQPFIDYFCNAGYAVFKPDYRGNGTSQGQPVSGQFDPGYTYDILNLVASLPSNKSLNATRVGLIGHSLGGAVVLRALVASHGLPIKAAVFMAGVVGSLENIAYNWPGAPADVAPYRAAFIEKYGTPQQNPTLWHDASAINYVSQIDIPVQINVDSGDSVVPPAFSASLNQAMTAAGKTPQYLTYPGDDHQFSSSTNRAQLVQQIASFFAAHI
jgi:dipeptidyl aminopeptidase/acylaminoacyl peptidase